MRLFVTFSAASLLLTGLALAEPNNTSSEQWHRAKYGRSTPRAEAKAKADASNTAYRADTNAAPKKDTGLDDARFRAKYGRNTPAEEAKRNAEASNTAFRADEKDSKDRDWKRDYMKSKYGRDTSEK